MLATFLSIAAAGHVACFACYYLIQRRQVLPVIASAASTLLVIVITSWLPQHWSLQDATYHAFWLGSSFCGMNNNAWVNIRNIHWLWLLYAALFYVVHAYLPLPGGYLGTLALLASSLWVLSLSAIAKSVSRTRSHF